MRFAIETHCHSHYSHDSELSIRDIIQKSKERGLNGVIICDHDCCEIIDEDVRAFTCNSVTIYKAIEFTTKEGAHIIGVSDNIKKVQREKYGYSAGELIDELILINALIIIPHPDHLTGIIGCGMDMQIREYVIKNAHAVEIENYKYGKTKSIKYIIGINKKLVPLVGSDAHSRRQVGVFNNVFSINRNEVTNLEILGLITSSKPLHIKLKSSNIWRVMSVIKRSTLYQFFLHQFSPEIRTKVKNALFNK